MQGAKVLLVDDNRINQEIAIELLEGFGLQVHSVYNGQECLEVVEKRPFDLILMDIQMPVMDGMQATKRLRQDPRFKTLPIIAMTAHAIKGDRERFLACGMDDYIAKPIDPNQLSTCLSQWIFLQKRERTTPHQTVPLPKQLPGIDIRIGLNNVAGNQPFFHKLLREFCQDYHNIVSILRSLLNQEGGKEEVQRLTHTIKGIAASLGAKELSVAVSNIERAVKEERSEQYDDLLNHFETALQVIFQGLTVLDEISSPPESENIPVDLEKLPPLFQKLLPMLKAGLPSAAKKAKEIQNHLNSSKYRADSQTLLTQIEDYDFEEALQSFFALARLLEIPLDEERP